MNKHHREDNAHREDKRRKFSEKKGGVNECKPISSVCSKICLVAMTLFNQICDDDNDDDDGIIIFMVQWTNLLLHLCIQQDFLITEC